MSPLRVPVKENQPFFEEFPVSFLPPHLETPWKKLEQVIQRHGPMAVAYSGGVDSALLAYAARETLGDDMVCVIAVSPSLAEREHTDAVRFLDTHAIPYESIETNEMEDVRYAENTPERCYFCKNELFSVMREFLPADRFPKIAYGANVDDLVDHRPGSRAAGEQDIIAPLSEAGFTKQMIRESARALGLEVWDKPAAPCLASRIPYQSPVTVEKLRQVEAAEGALKDAGFRTCRVRHHQETARIEVPVEDHKKLFDPALWPGIVRKIKNAGFEKIEVETDGFRSGRLNDTLDLPADS
jgi:uncharacterized protein